MTNMIKIRMHVLSPVHIGCGEVYEPTSFYVDSETGRLHVFDPLDLIDSLDDAGRKSVEKVCGGDNLLAIIKETARLAASTKVPSLSSVEMANGLLEHYKKVLKMSTYKRDDVINQFTLERTVYNPNGGFPYIPGSSVKGAIRTAYLNALNKGDGNFSRESDLLGGSFEHDPFRLLKVSDLSPVTPPSTRLIYAINIRKNGGAGTGPFQILETISHGVIFEGTLSLSQPLQGAKVKALPSFKDLLSCLNIFSEARYSEDKTVMDKIGAAGYSNELSERLGKFNGDLRETTFLMRLGRHGGAESHTLDGVRKIRIKQQNNTYTTLDHATTMWFAAEDKTAGKGLPFGWAVLEMLSMDAAVKTCCDDIRDDRAIEVCARRAKSKQRDDEEAKRRTDEDRRLKMMEEEKCRAEEEAIRLKAEWDLLSEEERLIRTLAVPDVTEQQVVECFNKLESITSPHTEKLAEAIKQYYVKNGKWEGGSKKQMEKVKKLKKILDE